MRLVQNTSNNRQNKTNNYLRNVSCKKRWHFRGHFHNNIIIITKDNILSKLQFLKKYNNFVSKHSYKV